MNWLNAYGDNSRINAYNARYLTQADDDVKESIKPTAFQGMGDAVTKALPAAFQDSVSSWSSFMQIKMEQGIEADEQYDLEDTSDIQKKAAERVGYEARLARKKKEQEFTPNPDTTGVASQAIYNLLGFAAKGAGYVAIGGLPAGAMALGADVGINKADSLRDKGVRADVAAKAGWVEGVGTTVGFLLPSAVSTSVVKSALVGATVNPAFDVAQQSAVNQILIHYNYKDVAAEYDPFNGVSLTTSAVLGGLFGAIGARSMRGASTESVESGSSVLGDKAKKAFNALGDTEFGHKVGEATAPVREKTVKISHDVLDAAMELKSAFIHQKDQLVGKVGSVARSLRHEKTAREQIDDGQNVNVDGAEIDPEALMEQVGKVSEQIQKEVSEATDGKYRVDVETGTVVPNTAKAPSKPKKKKSRKQRKAEKMDVRKEGQRVHEEEQNADLNGQGGMDVAVNDVNEDVRKVRDELTPQEEREIQEELRAEQRFQEQQELPSEKMETLKKLAPDLPESTTSKPEDVKQKASPEEVAPNRSSEPEETKSSPEETTTVAQILNGIIDDAPLPDDAKALVKEAVAEQHNMFSEADAAQRTLDEPPAEHPRKGVFTPEQALDNKVDKMLEEQPDMFIVDENGNQIGASEFIEDAQLQAKADTDFAQALGEAASCMFQQGAFDQG